MTIREDAVTLLSLDLFAPMSPMSLCSPPAAVVVLANCARVWRRSPHWLGWVVGVVLSSWAAQPAIAQEPRCAPPNEGEYVLLVRRSPGENDPRFGGALPPNVEAVNCDYVGEPVARVGPFPAMAIAEAWGDLIRDRLGREAFIIEPSPQSLAGAAFRPRPLGAGYAVLVDYFSQPQVAAQLRQTLARPVGVVSYGQRPYLLALHATRQGEASAELQRLSDRGFSAVIVDGRQVVLLRESVALPGDR